MADDLIKSVIKDKRRDIRYVIWAKEKLDRDGMLKQIKIFNTTSINIKQKYGSTVEIYVDQEKD